jgi:hypothetical protein
VTKTRHLIAAAAIFAAAFQLVAPIEAHASLPTISPGDRIDYVTEDGAASFCTTGYVYTGSNGHAYAITAGHCQTDEPGHVIQEDSSATGRFVNTVVAPPRSGGPDYGLIDFGSRVVTRAEADTIDFDAAGGGAAPSCMSARPCAISACPAANTAAPWPTATVTTSS